MMSDDETSPEACPRMIVKQLDVSDYGPWYAEKLRVLVTEGPTSCELEWLNKLLDALWPRFNRVLTKALQEDVLPSMQAQVPRPLRLEFTHLDFGNRAPVWGPIIVDTKEDGIHIDIELVYDSDGKIVLDTGIGSIGVSRLHVVGALTVVVKPLLEELPILGGAQVFFANPPEIDIDFHGLANVLDFPLIGGLFRKTVHSKIAKSLVLPNRQIMSFGSSHDVNFLSLQNPEPAGMLRLRVVEAKNLEDTDWALFGKNKSDPYCIVSIGSDVFRTDTIKDNCNPVWNNAVHDFLVFHPRQWVSIDIYDEDFGRPDDHLGSVRNVPISDLVNQRDIWLSLTTNPSVDRKIHLRTQWFRLHSSIPDDVCPRHSVIVANIDTVRGVSHGGPGDLRVRLRHGDQTSKSFKGEEVKEDFSIQTAILASSVQKLIVHLKETGMDEMDIASCANLGVDVVKDYIAMNEEAKTAPRMFQFRQEIDMLIKGLGGEVTVELLDGDKNVVASFSHCVEELVAAPEMTIVNDKELARLSGGIGSEARLCFSVKIRPLLDM